MRILGIIVVIACLLKRSTSKPCLTVPDGFDRNNQESLSSYLEPEIKCSREKVEIKLDKCQLYQINVVDIFVSTTENPEDLDPSCRVVTGHSGRVEFKFKPDVCPPLSTSQLGYTYNVVARTFISNEVVEKPINIQLTCFLKNMTRRVVNADMPKLWFKKQTIVDFPLDISLFEDDTYETKILERTFTVPDTIYVEIQSLDVMNPEHIIQARDCWATPTPDPNFRVRFGLIHFGKPMHNPIEHGDTATIYANGNETIQTARFSFNSFQWLHGTENLIYLHCRMFVCQERQECQEFIAKHAIPPPPISDDAVHAPPHYMLDSNPDPVPIPHHSFVWKRSIPGSNTQLASLGPVRVKSRFCGENNGGCMHFCNEDNRNCSCKESYKLMEDKISCKPINFVEPQHVTQLLNTDWWYNAEMGLIWVHLGTIILLTIVLLSQWKKRKTDDERLVVVMDDKFNLNNNNPTHKVELPPILPIDHI